MIASPALKVAASLALSVVLSAAIVQTGAPTRLAPDNSAQHQQSVQTPVEEYSDTPVWARCIAPASDITPGRNPEYRSMFASRGLASASFLRPQVVLATYRDEKEHKGESLTNARNALLALDRIVIPPGSEFSFNRTVGPRHESRGYEKGLMFSQGQVIWGMGGGVCIASTALYNAALIAGLPIVERWMHSGPVSYAEPTRDASVVYGSKDLVIKNNTPYPIWVRAIMEDGFARVSLLTTARTDTRVVLKQDGVNFIPSPLEVVAGESATPEVIKEGSPGCNATLVRLIYKNGKLAKREQICHDVREPQARVIAIADAGVSETNSLTPDAIKLPMLPEMKLPEVQPEPLRPLQPVQPLPAQTPSTDPR